jgi:signal transduction histidine kinase
LGLYIVKNAITKLKGQITVESIYGTGSTFTIELPNLINNKE